MSRRITVFAVTLIGLCTLASSQETMRFDIGKVVSTAFLLRLTNPDRTAYRVGVVHTEASTGMLVPHRNAPASVEFVRGSSAFLWSQAAAQASTTHDNEDPIHFEVTRWKLDATSCPSMAARLETFLGELERVLSSRVVLSSPPPKKYQAVGPDGHEVILLDGAQFLIQVALSDGTLTVKPDSGSNPPLQRAAGALHSTVSGCSDVPPPSVATGTRVFRHCSGPRC